MLDGIRWVLFDAVGTLIYPDPPVAAAYHAVGRRHGSQLTIDEIRQRFAAALTANHSGGGSTSEANERIRWQSIVSEVMYDVAEAHSTVLEHLWEHFAQPQHWRLYDDVAATLSELRRRGFHLGIASNFDARLKPIVDAHPSLNECEQLFVSSEIGFTKPNPRFFSEIVKRLAVDPSQIALVGDDELSDVEGATAAGWRAIHLDRDAKKLKPATIRTLAELLS